MYVSSGGLNRHAPLEKRQELVAVLEAAGVKPPDHLLESDVWFAFPVEWLSSGSHREAFKKAVLGIRDAVA